MKKYLPLFALFYSVLLFESAFAGFSYWNTNVGDWTNAANWSNAAVPAAADWAYIDNGGQANLTAASATIWGVLVGVRNGNNKLAISNGGALSNGASGGAGYVGYASSNNTALVTGTGSLWQNNSDLYVGWSTGALRNTLVISNGGRVASANPYGFGNFGGYTYIGYEAAASGNNALITGTDSLLTNTRSLFVGHTSGGNSLVVSNGGKVANADLFIGYTNLATNNSVQVTGTGSLLTNSGNMYVGAFSQSIYNIAPDGGYNSLTIADGGTAVSVDGFIGYGGFASYNTVQVTGTNSLWTNSRDLYVGFSGRGNRLVITNGGEVFVGGSLVISAQARATNYTYLFFDNPTNRVSVVGGRLVVTNGQINVGAATPGALYVTGGTVEVKTLTATNGTNSAIAFNGGAINSSATAINNRTNFTIGDTGSGAAFTARVGTHTFASDLVVGNTGSSNSLVITNGGEVFIGTNMVLSAQAGASNNSVSISSGRLVVTNGTLEIGRSGSGALNVTGGSVELKTLLATNGTNSVIALNGGTIASQSTTVSNGTNFVIGDTGSGASFIANGGSHSFASNMVVGNSGSGNSLVISNGGSVTNSVGHIGSAVNSSNNSALVTGTNSLWTNSGILYVGFDGRSNSLVVSGGGTVASQQGYIGSSSVSSNNSALVTGSGSLWTTPSDFRVGREGDSNSLTISNGGRVASANGYIGTFGNSSGNSALVTGTNSVWTNSSDLRVGREGSGNSLIISNAGVAAGSNGYIGSATISSNNSALVTGASSLWTNSGALYVGNDGSSNSLIISNGGRVANGQGSIGYTGFSSNNSALVTGANSVWTNSGYFYVGAYGSSNSLVVSNGGTVAALISQIGTFGSSLNNSVLVTGTNTLFNNALYLFVGGSGNSGNSMVISNGGLVTVGIHSYIGGDVAANNNSVLVTGAGSRWSNASSLFVGSAGVSNRLVITNGGEVFVGADLSISAQAGASNNSVTIGGGRLVVTNNGQINIGVAGSGALNVTGGTVEVKTLIATNGANSALTFNGGTIVSRGTAVSNATDFYVGDTGSGATFIANGGGHNFASNMVVGNSGSGNSLIISNGATMTNFRAWIGYNLGSSNNSVLVTGTNSLTGSNSLWTNRSSLRLGSSGSGNSLVISNGGRAFFILGLISFFAESSNNTVQVTGTNSIMTSGNAFYFGYYGSASSLLVSNGGTLAGTEGYLGLTATASNNSALITGANSLWTNSGQLWVGYEGISNSLTVSAGGTVVATNIVLGSQAGSSGALNIGRFGTNDTAGTITAPTIAFGAGAGAINFNQSDATTITAAISGDGAVKQLGAGTTTLSASNTYTGDTTISAGTLRFSTANGAGGSRILQTTMASLVEFLGSGRMTNQMTVSQYSFANSFETAGQVTLADAASSIAVASGATVTGSGSFVGSGGLIKKGAGTLSLTAANSFSGPLNVQAGTVTLAASGSSAAGSVTSLGVTNGATLLVSQSNQVNNSASVTLSGGTITRGSGVSEVFGNLNLTQASFLDFGSGAAGNLTFGTYAPSALLTVNNFLPGNTLVFGSDLRNSINSTNLFQFSGGFTSAWNGSNSTFTITAIPEPSTYLAALGLLALMLWPLRRRLHAKVS